VVRLLRRSGGLAGFSSWMVWRGCGFLPRWFGRFAVFHSSGFAFSAARRVRGFSGGLEGGGGVELSLGGSGGEGDCRLPTSAVRRVRRFSSLGRPGEEGRRGFARR